MGTGAKQLLVWRYDFREEPEWSGPVIRTPTRCRWCRTPLATVHLDRVNYAGFDNLVHDQACPLCGWRYDVSWTGDGYGQQGRVATMYSSVGASLLRKFEIGSSEVLLAELGAHLKRQFSDVFAVPWRRFEMLVADVFARNGAAVELTQATRDGGADVLVYSHGGVTGIIECKKHAEDRVVGVKEVRALVGAAVDWDVRDLWLVTTTEFSKEAIAYAARNRERGYEIELVKGTDLLSLLGVYNEELPPLDQIDEFRRELIVEDSRRWFAAQR